MVFDGASTFLAGTMEFKPFKTRIHLTQFLCTACLCSSCKQYSRYQTCLHTILWKLFTQWTECFKEIQRVLKIEMPEFKIVKPSDTQCLAHEDCVKVEKENYCAIVIALNNIYEETHEPEALGISKALSKKSSTVT